MADFVSGGMIILVGLKEDFKEQVGYEKGHTGRVGNRIYVASPENTGKKQASSHECQCALGLK